MSKPAEGGRREVLLPREALEALADRVAGPWTDDEEGEDQPCPYCGHSNERPSLQRSLDWLTVETRQLPWVERLALFGMFWAEMPIPEIVRAAAKLSSYNAVARALERAKLKLKLTGSRISIAILRRTREARDRRRQGSSASPSRLRRRSSSCSRPSPRFSPRPRLATTSTISRWRSWAITGSAWAGASVR